jgi:DNA primase
MPSFTPSFLDELRSRTPIAALIGRRVKLVRAGRQWKGNCPFHGEKSPSFYVYDDHFHCFGCGVHGDAVAFVMQSQGASFPEAVTLLAAEAGLELPRDDESPARAAQVSREQRLLAVLEAAASLFHEWLLSGPDAQAARRTLTDRGVARETLASFRLGWSGDGTKLRPTLAAAGFEPELQREAGLLHVAEDGSIRGEMFRNRITFPIADKRGRTVGFGGRAMGDAQPKYLNGPETPVFSKRRLLYGHDRAQAAIRAPVARGAGRPKLVIVEGYMDVVAMAEAGFPAAVAPLGTALGEEQLDAAWRLDPAPILCLDGDAAGRNAARRAAERALPLVTPERTLLIATLDAGEDPDSLFRRHGAAVLGQRLDAARPLSDALYDLLDPPAPGATPELRAAFRARLMEAASRVADRSLASEYRRALVDRFYGQLRSKSAAPSREPRPPLSDEAAREERACLLAVTAFNNPAILGDVEDAWARLELPEWLARLRAAVVELPHPPDPGALDSSWAIDHLRLLDCEKHLSRAQDVIRRRGGLPHFAHAGAMPAEAEQGWWHFFGLMQHARLDEEIDMARSLLARDFNDRHVMRVTALVEAREKLRSLDHDARV